MNILALILLAFGAFALQYLLTFVQMQSFTKHYTRLRKMGRVAIGRKKGALTAGAIVLFALDSEGIILEGSAMQGVTVLARFHTMKKGFVGRSIEAVTADDCKTAGLATPLKKAVLDAVYNYRTITNGGEVPTPPSPFKKITGFFAKGKETMAHIPLD